MRYISGAWCALEINSMVLQPGQVPDVHVWEAAIGEELETCRLLNWH